MEKITEQFRELHRERQDLIQQWETSLKQVVNRDSEIEVTKNELLHLESRVQEERLILSQKQQGVEQIEEDIRTIEKAIVNLERVAAFKITDSHNKKAELNEFKAEVESLRSSLASGSPSLVV